MFRLHRGSAFLARRRVGRRALVAVTTLAVASTLVVTGSGSANANYHTYIRNAVTGYAWDIPYGNYYNHAYVTQYAYHGGEPQQFAVGLVERTGDEYWYRIYARNPVFCVDVTGYSTARGAALQLYECHGGWNQQFKFVPQPDKSAWNGYLIVARHSRQCVDVPGNSYEYGMRLWQWPCNGGPAQRWFPMSWDGRPQVFGSSP